MNAHKIPPPSKPRASIIIPVLNEEEGIKETIDRIPEEVKKHSEVLVIDGSSDDDTVIEAEKAGAEIIIAERVGKGFAMRLGAQLARGEVLLFIDGDGSYPSEAIPEFLERVEDNVVVIGNAIPYIESRKSLLEKLKLLYPNFLLTRFIFSMFGIRLQDPLNGMRAIMRRDFKRLNLKAKGFEIETEIDIKALNYGLDIIENPITITPRKGESKFLFNFESHLKIIRLLRDKKRRNWQKDSKLAREQG